MWTRSARCHAIFRKEGFERERIYVRSFDICDRYVSYHNDTMFRMTVTPAVIVADSYGVKCQWLAPISPL